MTVVGHFVGINKMAENSKIEWTDHTFNPWRGCTKVAAGCANCYADSQAKRNPGTLGIWGDNGTRVVASESMWKQPLKWNEAAFWDESSHVFERDGLDKNLGPWKAPRVFCASMADVFEDWCGSVVDSQGRQLFVHDCEPNPEPFRFVPMRDDLMPHERQNLADGMFRPVTLADVRRRLFSVIDSTPNLDWLLLTKRPENIRKMWLGPTVDTRFAKGNLETKCHRKNVWLGTSIACQEDADRNIPELLKCRELAPVLFLSIEPLIGPIDGLFDDCCDWACGQCGSRNVDTEVCVAPDDVSTYACHACGYVGGGEDADWKPLIDWVIVGGESGLSARPMHPDWVRSVRDQCQAAGVPFFFKQWGEYWPIVGEQKGGRFDGAGFSEGTPGSPDLPDKPNGYSGWEFPDGVTTMKVGKKYSGRRLDGREWNEMPEVKR